MRIWILLPLSMLVVTAAAAGEPARLELGQLDSITIGQVPDHTLADALAVTIPGKTVEVTSENYEYDGSGNVQVAVIAPDGKDVTSPAPQNVTVGGLTSGVGATNRLAAESKSPATFPVTASAISVIAITAGGDSTGGSSTSSINLGSFASAYTAMQAQFPLLQPTVGISSGGL